MKVKDIMTASPASCTEDTPLHRALYASQSDAERRYRRGEDDGYAKAVNAYRPLVRACWEEHGGNNHEPECPICDALKGVSDEK